MKKLILFFALLSTHAMASECVSWDTPMVAHINASAARSATKLVDAIATVSGHFYNVGAPRVSQVSRNSPRILSLEGLPGVQNPDRPELPYPPGISYDTPRASIKAILERQFRFVSVEICKSGSDYETPSVTGSN